MFLNRHYLSIVIWLLCIIGTVFSYCVVSKTFLPPGDSGAILGSFQVPLGTAEKPIIKYQDTLNEVLSKNPNIDNFVTISGIYSGADQSLGSLAIMLKPEKNRKPMSEVITEIRNDLARIPYNLGEVYLVPVPVLEMNTAGTSTAGGAQYSYIVYKYKRRKCIQFC